MKSRQPVALYGVMGVVAWTALWAPNPARGAVGAASAVAVGRPDAVGGYSTRHIVIKLTPSAQEDVVARGKALRRAKAPGANGTGRRDVTALLSQTVRGEAARWNATRITPLVDWEPANPELAKELGFDRLYVVHFPQGMDTPRAARAFRAHRAEIESAETDGIGTVAGIPDDAEFDRLWGMHNTGSNPDAPGLADADIDAPEAWDIHTGAAGDVTIAIIDSGIDEHPDLPNVIEGRNTDNAAVGTADDCSHGTHVAGTAAGAGNNGIGVVGVSWGARLMPVRVTTDFFPPYNCIFRTSSLIAGIIWAADHGADVANMSLQLGPVDAATEANLQNAIDYGRSLGMISIAATGNNNFCADLGGVCFPARLPRTIAVGATTSTDQTASFANTGIEMDVAAPGKDIYSACIAGGQLNTFCDLYAYLNGTSMATPHASGLAALLMSFDPTLTLSELEDIITTTAEEANNNMPGWDEEVGYGRINAHEALLAAQVWPTILSSSPANGAIDARQSTDPLSQQDFGVASIDMDFPPDVAATLTVDDFSLVQKGGMLAPADVVDVQLLDKDTARVSLSAMIEPLAWTTVAHHTTGIVRIGFLPGDVDANQVVTSDDAVALADHFLGVGDPLAEWSTDLDRSGATTPLDLLTLVNLLQGGGLPQPALGTNLP